MKPRSSLLLRAALVGVLAWFLWLPLADLLRYPDRVSVLGNLQADAAAYHDTARELAAARRLDVIPVRHPPGWVTMLGAVYAVTGPSYVAGKLLSWIALIGSVALCAWLARRIHGPRAAWVAALLCAASPGLRAYVGTLQYEVMTGAWLLVVLALAVRTLDAHSRAQLLLRAALTGCAGAVLVLTREPYAAVVTLTAIWIASQPPSPLATSVPAKGPPSRPATSVPGKEPPSPPEGTEVPGGDGGSRRGRRLPLQLAAAALMLLIAATPPLAWSVVQSVREGRLITISEQGPIVMEVGFNTRANGTYNTPLVGIGPPTGLAFIREFPGRTLVLSVRKVLYFWGVLRDGWNVPRPAAVWIWRATTGLLPLWVIEPIVRGGWLLALFIAALWALGADGFRRWWIFPAAVCTILAVHIITLASYRFSVSVLPVVYIVVSGLLATLAARAASVLRAPAVAIACAVLLAIMVAMQFQAWPLQLDYEAVDLDGANADNDVDPVSQHPARIADARRGARPIALLTDQYLPRGLVTVTVRARRASEAAAPDTAVMAIVLMPVDGRAACAVNVAAANLPSDRFHDIEVPCRLTADAPATLIVQSLGASDLAVERVSFRWTGGP